MPHNRVRRVTDLVVKRSVLDYLHDINRSGSNSINKEYEVSLPRYIPGLLFYPIPEAGYCLRRIDIGFWANFLVIYHIKILISNHLTLITIILSVCDW